MCVPLPSPHPRRVEENTKMAQPGPSSSSSLPLPRELHSGRRGAILGGKDTFRERRRQAHLFRDRREHEWASPGSASRTLEKASPSSDPPRKSVSCREPPCGGSTLSPRRLRARTARKRCPRSPAGSSPWQAPRTLTAWDYRKRKRRRQAKWAQAAGRAEDRGTLSAAAAGEPSQAEAKDGPNWRGPRPRPGSDGSTRQPSRKGRSGSEPGRSNK